MINEGRSNGFILDAGALIALDRHDRRIISLLARSLELASPITIPATALAQALRNPSRQAKLSRLIRQVDTRVIPLDKTEATSVGRLLARSGTADIADAHVVLCAERAGQIVLSSDASDLHRISPTLRVIPI